MIQVDRRENPESIDWRFDDAAGVIHCVRGCSQMRNDGMRSSKEEKGNQDEKLDRSDREEPGLVPPDLDIEEGDEEKNEETDLPPAMPPKV